MVLTQLHVLECHNKAINSGYKLDLIKYYISRSDYLLGRSDVIQSLDAAYFYACLDVQWSGIWMLLVTNLSPAKTDEPTELPFGGLSGPKELYILWKPDPLTRRSILRGTRTRHPLGSLRNVLLLACNGSITPLQCGLRPPLQQELGKTYYEADLDGSAGEAEVMQVFTKLQQQKCTFITACHQVTVVQTLCQQRHRLRPSITQS